MKTAVIGASGYAGGELLRLLAIHPHFQVTVVSAHSNAGEQVTAVHPQLQSYAGRSFVSTDSIDFSTLELVFLALPHGESASLIAKIPATVKIVDLGADFRLEDAAQWEKYYGGKHAGAWVYGLPELAPGQREAIKKESKVANPGCYATSISLGIAPALNMIDVSDIVVVAASGTTGAGRSAKINLIGSEVMGSLTSYKFGGVHQHTPEIEQVTGAQILFTPHLAPMNRGILATCYARPAVGTTPTTASLLAVLARAYAKEPLIVVGQNSPSTKATLGTNVTHITARYDERTGYVMVLSALDNLAKGASGGAVQAANVALGLNELDGLSMVGMYP
jgi:N-acetyl-gamma-glutamyl-phosphate reductase